MTELHLILGGAKSGKSFYAEKVVSSLPPPYIYIATAEALDEEMAERVMNHKKRRGKNWVTYEEPLKLVELLRSLSPATSPILVDCLTLWLSNLLIAGGDVEKEVEELCRLVRSENFPLLVMVSNEVGLGIVPSNELSRKFRDLSGWTHQKIATVCTHVTWMVAGIPIAIKHPYGGTPFISGCGNGRISPGR